MPVSNIEHGFGVLSAIPQVRKSLWLFSTEYT